MISMIFSSVDKVAAANECHPWVNKPCRVIQRTFSIRTSWDEIHHFTRNCSMSSSLISCHNIVYCLFCSTHCVRCIIQKPSINESDRLERYDLVIDFLHHHDIACSKNANVSLSVWIDIFAWCCIGYLASGLVNKFANMSLIKCSQKCIQKCCTNCWSKILYDGFSCSFLLADIQESFWQYVIINISLA